ncbi:type II secretion system F family protein [Desulfobulbus elongatus]|uniref:type II secretion system F family protein n=1 Tax=Desulfobulbus elongatus TaxID=53332 RepID=UPI000482F740|nr:type II secretion system F family protein [Desulfobulbus elongatus]
MFNLRLSKQFVEAMDRLAFSWPVREALYRHLSAQISNGVTIEAALDAFRARLLRNKRKSSAGIVGSVARRMRDGASLASALGAWVPQDEASLIAGGELAGNLPQSLELIIESTRRIEAVNRALKAAMVTPVFYLLAVYFTVWAIGRYVSPALQQALPKYKASGLIYGLYVAGDLANSLWAILPAAVVALIVGAVIRSMTLWTGRWRIMAERVFPYSFYRDVQGYRWLMSFVALLRAGMPDTEILYRQMPTATPWLKERLHFLWWHMNNGSSLPVALMSKGRGGQPPFGFPNPDMVDDIASIAGFADFYERITKLTMQWADEMQRITQARIKAYGIVMEVLMYAVIGMLMMAINSMSVQLGSISV